MAHLLNETQVCQGYLASIGHTVVIEDVHMVFDKVYVKTYQLPVDSGGCWHVGRVPTRLGRGSLVTLWWAGMKWDVTQGFWTGYVGQIGDVIAVYSDQVVCEFNSTRTDGPSHLAIPHSFFIPPTGTWQSFTYRIRKMVGRSLAYPIPQPGVTVSYFP